MSKTHETIMAYLSWLKNSPFVRQHALLSHSTVLREYRQLDKKNNYVNHFKMLLYHTTMVVSFKALLSFYDGLNPEICSANSLPHLFSFLSLFFAQMTILSVGNYLGYLATTTRSGTPYYSPQVFVSSVALTLAMTSMLINPMISAINFMSCFDQSIQGVLAVKGGYTAWWNATSSSDYYKPYNDLYANADANIDLTPGCVFFCGAVFIFGVCNGLIVAEQHFQRFQMLHWVNYISKQYQFDKLLSLFFARETLSEASVVHELQQELSTFRSVMLRMVPLFPRSPLANKFRSRHYNPIITTPVTLLDGVTYDQKNIQTYFSAESAQPGTILFSPLFPRVGVARVNKDRSVDLCSVKNVLLAKIATHLQQEGASIHSASVVDELSDPISHTRLQSAMVDRHGHTYSAAELLTWLYDHPTAPLVNLPCNVNDLIFDLTTQKILQQFDESRELSESASLVSPVL
jgi:hypothetical protein